MLRHNDQLDVYNYVGLTPFIIACSNSETESVKILLKYGQKVITLKGNESNPLHQAVINENTELLELLLEVGADIDHEYDGTPLSQAFLNKSKKMIQILLDKGANIHFSTDFGSDGLKTALCLAVDNNDIEMIKFLLDNGANVDPVLRDACPLELAIKYDLVPTVKLLIERGAKLTQIEGQNRVPPLILAVQLASISMVSLLLDSGYYGEGSRRKNSSSHDMLFARSGN